MDLGGDHLAKGTAEAVGQPRWRRAAPAAVTEDGEGERLRKWQVPRGLPDVRPRPPVLLMLVTLISALRLGWRREEISLSSSHRTLPASISSTGGAEESRRRSVVAG